MSTSNTKSTCATLSGRVAKDRLSRRKRAPVACQFCRIRKSRCDGVKPVCGFCQHHEAQCVWGRNAEKEEGSQLEHIILERLDEIKSLLTETTIPASTTQENLRASEGSAPVALEHAASALDTTTSQITASGPSSDLATIFARTRCESLLAWPIFRSIVPPEDATTESFVLDCADPALSDDSGTPDLSNTAPRIRRSGLSIPEELVVPLCRKFLVHVHPRNPILHAERLIFNARQIAEQGVQWDSASCLVLIVCALACYAKPFERSDGNNGDIDDDDYENDDLAHTFYSAAKKRFGLLGWTLIDVQCLFFASMYEKCLLKPLEAWFHIQQASTRLQAHLKLAEKPRAQSVNDKAFPRPDQQLQRLFWSVYRAEYELLLELPFGSSGLETFTRIDSMFPALPAFEPTLPETSPTERYREERNWAFYSAETSIRRTMTDTILTLFRKGEDYWLKHGQSIIGQCRACEQEIWTWYSHLPPSIRFDYVEAPDNQLAFYLRGRFNQWRIYVSIPVLYYVLHCTETHLLTPEILAFAQDSIVVYADSIVQANHHNRHGGTWICCRGTFSHALLILGVVLKADPRLSPPPNWTELISMSISTLRKWEAQAPDIRRMRTMLEQILWTVPEVIGSSPNDLVTR